MHPSLTRMHKYILVHLEIYRWLDKVEDMTSGQTKIHFCTSPPLLHSHQDTYLMVMTTRVSGN